MKLKLPPQLEIALEEEAKRQGARLEDLVLETLIQKFLPHATSLHPQDEWERKLFGAAVECGVSVPDLALSSEGLYD